MDEATINPFSDDLAQARADWSAAQASLKTYREAYLTGASARLAEILAAHDTLRQKVAAAETAKTEAEAEFKRAFEAAGFERTPVVQKMLNQRNDAMAVSEELQAASGRLEQEREPIYLCADQEAQAYKGAHTAAFIAYSRMRAFEILEKCGPSLMEALALMANVPREGVDSGGAYADEFTKKSRRRFLLEQLEMRAKDVDISPASLVPVIGDLQLGPLAGKALMSPIERMKKSQQIAQSNPTSKI